MVIRFEEKFQLIQEYWHPHVVGELNGQYIKLAKLKGTFVWHSHEHEDEYFQVVKGKLLIHLRDQTVTLNEGDAFIVPKGVEHFPEAEEETWVMLFEPKNTSHTGKVQVDKTVQVSDQTWI